MKEKKWISLTLSLVLLLSMVLPVRAEERPFPDVEGHWAQSVIEKWHSFGVIAGDTATGAFRPDDSLSRAEFATLLNRIMGYPLVEIKHFSDVPADSWYAETMSRLNSAGIIKGDGNNMVRPKDPVTRQEAAVILCRALGIEEQKADVKFLDADEISSWAEGAVGALYNMDAIQGWEGYFDPQDPITRVQAVTLLNNLIGAAMTMPGTWTQDVRGDFYVCTKRARLENMTVTGDLILTTGVDTGDVTLSNVRVKGDVIVLGCGERSLHVESGCRLEGDMVLSKTIDGVLRVVNESDDPIPSIQISKGKSTVILEGALGKVAVSCDVPVILRSGKTETLTVSVPNTSLTVEKEHTVSALTVEKEAKGTEIAVNGTVTALTTHAAAKITNAGKIDSAHAAASGLVLAGTKPVKVSVLSGAGKPKDGNGKTITPVSVLTSSGKPYTGSSGGGSSSGGSGSSSPSPSPSPSPEPSQSPEPSPSESPSPSPSESPEPSPSESPEPSPSESPDPTPSESPDPTPSESPDPSPSESPDPPTGGGGEEPGQE